MQGKEEDEGILSYVEDDDAAMCVSARRTFAVIFLECYRERGLGDRVSSINFNIITYLLNFCCWQ